MKNVLIPVDFSEISFAAARYAAGLVSQLHSETIVLYHSYAEVLRDTGFVNTDEQEQEACMSKLVFMKKRLQKLIPSDVNIELFCDKKTVKKGIQQILKERTVSFIVMGVSGLEHLDRDDRALGKHTRDIMSIKEVPLLVVPRFVKFRPVTKVALSTDLKGIDDNFPTVHIRKIVEQLHAELEIIYVNLPQNKLEGEEKQKASEALKIYLQGINYSFQILESEDDVPHSVLDFVQQSNSDLLVLVSKDYNFFNRLFHHSVSKRVLEETHIPVFIARE
ncbi:universal stress protein [Olivibacter sitiensis]|uniref:universal stress protein n=1 Tax=Olivibacter sitiensis TaxID=376470 RepID=UPI0003F839D6|nr:universal stress protein [Olivibacter sitiensis]